MVFIDKLKKSEEHSSHCKSVVTGRYKSTIDNQSCWTKAIYPASLDHPSKLSTSTDILHPMSSHAGKGPPLLVFRTGAAQSKFYFAVVNHIEFQTNISHLSYLFYIPALLSCSTDAVKQDPDGLSQPQCTPSPPRVQLNDCHWTNSKSHSKVNDFPTYVQVHICWWPIWLQCIVDQYAAQCALPRVCWAHDHDPWALTVCWLCMLSAVI